MNDLIRWQNVEFRYDGQFALKQIDYVLKEGDFALFFGPNGAGKSTLFKLAVGLLKPDRGEIFLHERSIAGLPVLEIAKQVAYLEQETNYLFPFTVEEVVLMGRFPHSANQFWDRKEDYEIAAWAMEVTGMLRFAKRSIFSLSGGERRKAEIARAICQKPKVFLLDEPTTFLDVKQQVEFFELLKRLHEQEHLTIGIISHQLGFARQFAASCVFMADGLIAERGPVDEILTEKRISELFHLNSRISLNVL